MKIMKFLLLITLLKINYCQLTFSNMSFINNEEISIDDAVYVIRTREGNMNLEKRILNYLYFVNEEKKNLKAQFLISKQEDNISNNITYFNIEDTFSKFKISSILEDGKEILKLTNIINNNQSLWTIIPKINSNNQLIYYVQNKYNQRFWEYDNSTNINNIILSSITNINNLTIKNEFQFIRMFRQSDQFQSEILENEPIDVLITYVDLSDINYITKVKIPRIKKDEDNKELKYSVRSILQNIPWIRKIFILMPNEKVSFFKPKEEIKEKIIYVKDNEYLGFDSASSPTLQFNLHKMKKFGLSENFILMDDDNFIAKPLNKSDFFYEENGKVYPCLITSDYYEMNKNKLEQQLLLYLSNRNGNIPHSTQNFFVQQTRSLLLMYSIFGDDNKRYGKKLIEPSFTHNATPLKLSDIEELYNYIIKYYIYANETLFAITRSSLSLQMQTTYTAYVKNKYDRKVVKISSAFYDLSQSHLITKNDKKLFVINTGLRNYRPYSYTRETKAMNELFPKKTKYELDYENDINNQNNILASINITKLIDLKKIAINNITKYFYNLTNNITNNITLRINYLKESVSKMNKSNEINYTNIFNEEIIFLKIQSKKLEYIKYIFLSVIFYICYRILIILLKKE